MTRAFLKAQGREADFVPLAADPGATYDEAVEIDLSALEPMVALPHMPDNVKTVAEAGPIRVDQVCIGSCTNSSYLDMMRVAAISEGQDRESRRVAGHRAGQPAGAEHAQRQRRPA